MIDYLVAKQDDKILSVFFKGTANMKNIGKINIMESVNLDMGSNGNNN